MHPSVFQLVLLMWLVTSLDSSSGVVAQPHDNQRSSPSTIHTTPQHVQAHRVQRDAKHKSALSAMTAQSPLIAKRCATSPPIQGNLSERSGYSWWRCKNNRKPEMDRYLYYTVEHKDPEECQVHLNVPEGKVMKLQVCGCFNADITIQQFDNGRRFYPDLLNHKCRRTGISEQHEDVYTLTNEVVFRLKRQSQYKVSLKFNLTIVNASDAPRLNVIYLSPSVGYIQSPENMFKKPVIDCATLQQPNGHVIFLTNPRQRTPGILHVSVGECGPTTNSRARALKTFEDLPLTFPDDFNPDRNIHDITYNQNQDTDLSMSLFYTQLWNNTGYPKAVLSVNFTFYPNSSKPYQIDHRWNCSVTTWPGLYRLFPLCDMLAHCFDAEDESDCPYTSKKYGAGYVEAGESQIFLMEGKTQHPILTIQESYAAAKRDCAEQGAVPVTFDYPQEWIDVVAALTSHRNYRRSHHLVDLRLVSLSLEKSTDLYKKNMYMDTWQWGNGAVAYYIDPSWTTYTCAYTIIVLWSNSFPMTARMPCGELKYSHNSDIDKYRLCKKIPNPSKHTDRIVLKTTINVTAAASRVSLVTCPLQHVTHAMFACDRQSLCSAGRVEARGMSSTVTCRMTLHPTRTVPYFACTTSSEEHVPFSAVCDWRQDCGDNSDESFCQFPLCGEGYFECGRGQCVPDIQRCDRFDDCESLLDEKFCRYGDIEVIYNMTSPPPALVNFERRGSFTVTPLPDNTTQCPGTHYRCPGEGYCLPVYTRCNDMIDCPGHEDEADCGVYTCEGLYRCRGLDRTICLHGNHLCDGRAQCPQLDDELRCGMTESCPDHCVCYGTHLYRPEAVLHLRYLEGRGSGLTSDTITNHTMLIHLGVGDCGWRNVSDIKLINLHVFDLSDNLLQTINFKQLAQLRNLKELILVGNPLSTRFLSSSGGSYKLGKLSLLNLSQVPDQYSNLHIFSDLMPQMKILDLSHTGLKSLKGDGFFPYLNILILRDCPISEFRHSFMKPMNDLKHVSGDNFKVCCSAVLPKAFTGKCLAPVDEISSCENLLKSGFYALILAAFALLALSGNLGCFVYRLTMFSAGRSKTGFLMFVIHLSMSDFLMGIYLSILGVTDRLYAGSYLWNEMTWKGSTACRIAGFLSLLSCEVSSFLICLITLDRFLVIRFPFSRLRFGTTSAQVACGVVWGLGVILASIPLLPGTSHWAFYSQTGICIPLPVTRTDFPGRHYSFAIMIVLNLVMFLLIAVGQAFIYWSVKANTLSSKDVSKNKDDVIVKDKTRSKEFTIARRLLVIAVSDFLCWFPIGVCGLLAKLDIPVPGEVNAAMATIVLPVNAALNPFLYTYTILRQRRQKEKEAILQRFVIAQVKNELAGSRR